MSGADVMIKFINLGVVCFVLTGCISQVVSFRDHIKSWKGQPISEFIEASKLGNVDRSQYKGTERISKQKSGHLIYEFPYQYCPVFFEVDSKGIIVDITTKDNKDCY